MATSQEGSYSTLEAAYGEDHKAQKEVVRRSWEDLPQAVNPEAAPGKGPYHYHWQYPASDAVPFDHREDQKGRRRICGLVAKTFWIIAALVALGVAGAIVGGVVGGVLANRPDESSPESGEAPDSASGSTTTLLNMSKVAAVNWTDTGHFSHYAVFSQDSTDALFVSVWDSKGQTWTAVNISAAMAKNGSPIKAKSGTPLTAVSIASTPTSSFQVTLYFLTPANIISEIYTKDIGAMEWGLGQLPASSPKTVDDNSPLASVWHRCDSGCTNLIYVTYLSDNNVHLLNSSDWSESESLLGVDPGSPLTMFPFIGPYKETGDNDSELRLYFTQDGDLEEFKFGINRTWAYGLVVDQDSLSSPLPQLAGAPFDDWWQILLLQLDTDGTLTGHRWDNSSWSNDQKISLKKGPSNPKFTAIAQHHEGRLYGILEGILHEYRWDKSDPYSMLYVGKVSLGTDS